MEPIRVSIAHFNNHIVFGLQTQAGERVAIDLPRTSAQFLAIAGRQDDEKAPTFDADFEMLGKLFCASTPKEASCDPEMERWEGPILPLRFQIEEQPRRLIFSVRDPQNSTGFVLKLTDGARGALFGALGSTADYKGPSSAYIEGDLEICQ